MKRFLVLAASHGFALLLGFALGVYALPILIAPPAPEAAAVSEAARSATLRGEFRRDLKDSDALHWGEGTITVGPRQIAFDGQLAPGPDYKLYLSPEFVETEADFKRLKAGMLRVGDVKTFDRFLLDLPAGVDLARYPAVIIWCETFNEFITAARLQ